MVLIGIDIDIDVFLSSFLSLAFAALLFFWLIHVIVLW